MATNFTNPTRVVALSQLGFIHAEGADARSFLQGQLSNDLRKLTPELAQLTSYNSPKGRMLAVLQLLADGDDVLIELHQSVLAATLKRLRLFVLRSKVVLTDVSASRAALGIAGPQAAALLAAQSLPAPEPPQQCARAGELIVLRRLGALPRFSIHGPAATIAALQQAWRDEVQGDVQDWQRCDILAGVPTVFAETSDHFVPQMANLDQLGGISFDKGCYTGQEIVARLHYLGQLKRRMFACRSTALPVAPGTAIYVGGETQAIGEVLQSTADAEGSMISAVLQLGHAASGDLHLGSTDGARLQRLPD